MEGRPEDDANGIGQGRLSGVRETMMAAEKLICSLLAQFDTIRIERVLGRPDVEILLQRDGELIAGAEVPQDQAGEHVSSLFEMAKAFSD
jgi:hypothetical protein